MVGPKLFQLFQPIGGVGANKVGRLATFAPAEEASKGDAAASPSAERRVIFTL
jgi:hypothetical protein